MGLYAPYQPPAYLGPNGVTEVDDGGWISIAPISPFTAFNSGSYPVRYKQGANGVVYFDGLVGVGSGAAWNDKMLQMPGHLYPDKDRYADTIAYDSSTAGFVNVRLLINASGNVNPLSGASIANISYIQLDTVFYHM